MNPTNESIGRLRELLVIRKKLESRNLPDSPWQQRHMQETMAYMPECAAFLYEHGETILAALESRELDRQAPGDKPFHAPGAWFPLDLMGNPMREYGASQWETASWPSESSPQPPAQEQGEIATLRQSVIDDLRSASGINALERFEAALLSPIRAAGAEDARDAENAAIADAFREWERRSNYWRGQRNARLWIREKADAAIASQAEGEEHARD